MGTVLDIRTTWGYIVGPGSVVDPRYYKGTNPNPMMDMPDTLIDWLTESRTDKAKRNRSSKRPSPVNTAANTEINYVVRGDEMNNTQFIAKQILSQLLWLGQCVDDVQAFE